MKTWIRISLLCLSIPLLLTIRHVLFETSYSGNSQIEYLNSGKPYSSLRQILQRPEFRNKAV